VFQDMKLDLTLLFFYLNNTQPSRAVWFLSVGGHTM